MSGRRRRLGCTGAFFLAALIAFAALTAPPASAVVDPPSDRLSAAVASGKPSAAAGLSALVRRPLSVLRLPGQAGAVIAHRGASIAAPENTLPALRSTAAAGAQYLEVDVRMSADGVPMIMHDATVDRTTDGTGAIAELTAAALRSLDAGSWFSEEFIGTRIPTLEEVLAFAARTDIGVVIEYKGSWGEAAIRTTIELITAAGLEDKVIAQSFSEKTVRTLAAVAPLIPVGWLTDRIDTAAVRTAVRIGADAVNPRIATPRGVELAHRARLGVFVWTQDEDIHWEELTAMGVDGIITNVPDELRSWLEERSDEESPRTR